MPSLWRSWRPDFSADFRANLLAFPCLVVAVICLLIGGITSVEMVAQCLIEKDKGGVPLVVQWLMNPTGNQEVVGSIPALAQWVNDPALP